MQIKTWRNRKCIDIKTQKILQKLKQQTVAYKIPADRRQTTMTEEIDSKHAEVSNLVWRPAEYSVKSLRKQADFSHMDLGLLSATLTVNWQ